MTESYNMYVFNTNIIFQKIPVELPKKPITKKKLKLLLHAIGGGWYVNKLGQNLPPLKKRRLSTPPPKEEDQIKRKLTEDNQYRNDWKFQIHWNKLELVNPRSCDEQKIHFVCILKIFLKDNVKTAHWFGH